MTSSRALNDVAYTVLTCVSSWTRCECVTWLGYGGAEAFGCVTTSSYAGGGVIGHVYTPGSAEQLYAGTVSVCTCCVAVELLEAPVVCAVRDVIGTARASRACEPYTGGASGYVRVGCEESKLRVHVAPAG